MSDRAKPSGDGNPAGKLWGNWNFAPTTVLWQAGEAYSKAFGDWQREMTRFTDARMRESQDLQAQLAKCRTMGDIAKLQQTWAMTAAKAYIDEATRMMEIFSKLGPTGGDSEKKNP